MQATAGGSPYLSYTEAEKYTTLNRVTLYRAVRAGHLKKCGYGRAVRFHVRDLDALMSTRSSGEDR
jgi:excisionase family DNA binding protein